MKIDKEEFEKMTKKYQKQNPGKTRAVIMDRESIERIMATKAEKIAVYFAENDEGKDTVAVIGVVDGKLDYNAAENRGNICPPVCVE